MESQEIRKNFIAFFKEKGLTEQPSSPLVPQGDPTLLFTSAGMVQFKPNFLGLKKNLKNACTCQKCLRTTDIDNVGFTKRHLTFFEMLGNFSFGDYFKKEAITWAWTYLTEVLKIDKNRLYVSIFKGGIAPRDEEAYNMWAQLIDKNRIYEFGEDDNFWTMGPTGPCGPCSEIYYDFGEDKGCPDCAKNGIACNCGRYVEIWNLVFTQFNRLEDGTLEQLPQKNIDTGMGLERLCMVMQNVDNPFDTDLFLPIINHAKKILKIEGKTAQEISALRIVADHLRASSFLLSEGVLPSNEGRGYILRRLIRRAFRYGKLMGRQTPFMHELVPTLISVYQDLYPQLVTNLAHIIDALKAEEAAFARTLNDGEARLNELLKENFGQVFSGKEAFNLYETYGFPLELTREILAEKNIKLDEDGFYQAQKEAKASSKAFTDENEKEHVLTLQQIESKVPSTVFVGYETLTCEAEIFALLDKNFKPVQELKDSGYVVTGRTPFYAECGGQVGDIGKILKDGKHIATVTDTQKPLEKVYLHKVNIVEGSLKEQDIVTLKVDEINRFKTASNHTAVHVINASLRKILGDQVHQAGSFVSAEKFRFDYTISKAPSPADLIAVWNNASDIIANNYKVETQVRPLSDAKVLGAVTLLGETYADPARFVLISREGFMNTKGCVSLELCGGTHVKSTGEIMVIRVLKESAVSSGVRRIEGVAGLSAIDNMQKMTNITLTAGLMLNTHPENLTQKIQSMIDEEKKLKKEISALRRQILSGASGGTLQESFTLKDGTKLICFNAENTEIKELRNLADNFANKNPNTVIMVITALNGKSSFVVKSFAGGPNAGKLTGQISALLNGRGGGRPDFAQGGGQVMPFEELKQKLKSL